jgi:hypothetical protein
MFEVNFDFRWSVPRAGFRWETGTFFAEDGAPIDSLLGDASQKNDGLRSYAPLQEATALFRTFSEVNPSKEGILDFANQYGSLGVATFFRAATGPPEVLAYGRFGERLDVWSQEILRMKEAVTLLDLVRARNEAGLSRLLRWREAHVDRLFAAWPDSWVYEGSGRQVTMVAGAPYTPSNVFAPALGLVMGWANEKLLRHTSLRLSSDDEDGGPMLEIRATTLLAALWIQFAQAVIRPASHRRCKTCGNWFTVSDDGRKADQAFCQDACKSKDYRQRKATAQQMANEGKPVTRIAEALQTDVATVKKWIPKRRVPRS